MSDFLFPTNHIRIWKAVMSRIYIALVFFALLLQSGLVSATQSFDYMADVDTVTSNSEKAYSLYIGMPYVDFRANFDALPDWTFVREFNAGVSGKCTVYKKRSQTNDEVIETVNVFTDKYRNIEYFYIFFHTDSKVIADKMYNKAEANIYKFNGTIKHEGAYAQIAKSTSCRLPNGNLVGTIYFYSPAKMTTYDKNIRIEVAYGGNRKHL